MADNNKGAKAFLGVVSAFVVLAAVSLFGKWFSDNYEFQGLKIVKKKY